MNRRELWFADLRGHGLARIGATRADVIDTPPSEYGHTAAWAEAVLEARADLDGLTWVSRQDDTATAFLFIDRGDTATTYEPLGAPQALSAGAGLTIVETFATNAGILITRTV